MKKFLFATFFLQLLAMGQLHSADYFRARPITELERVRAQIRLHMIEHVCQLSMWAGHAAVCDKLAKIDPAAAGVDAQQVIKEINATMAKDETVSEAVRKGFIRKISLYVQAQVATLEQIDLAKLEAEGRQEEAWKVLDTFNHEFHKNWIAIQNAMGNTIPAEARASFAKTEAEFAKDFPAYKPRAGAYVDHSVDAGALGSKLSGEASPGIKPKERRALHGASPTDGRKIPGESAEARAERIIRDGF